MHNFIFYKKILNNLWKINIAYKVKKELNSVIFSFIVIITVHHNIGYWLVWTTNHLKIILVTEIITSGLREGKRLKIICKIFNKGGSSNIKIDVHVNYVKRKIT